MFPGGLGRVVEPGERVPGFLIEGLLPESLTLCVGEPSAGKSTMIDSLVRALLDPADYGGYWLGCKINRGVGKVLWLATDTGEPQIRRAAFPDTSRVTVLEADPNPCWSEAATAVREEGFGLVVADHTAGLDSGDQNDGPTAQRVMGGLRSLGCPVIALHHASVKGTSRGKTGLGAAIGNTQWTATPRQVLTLTRPAASGSPATLKIDKPAHGSDLQGVSWTFVVDGGRPVEVDVPEETRTKRLSDEEIAKYVGRYAASEGIRLDALTANAGAEALHEAGGLAALVGHSVGQDRLRKKILHAARHRDATLAAYQAAIDAAA